MKKMSLFTVSFCLCFAAAAFAQPAPPRSAPDPATQKMIKDISAKNIENSIRKLVSFGTRNTLSEQNDPARGTGAAPSFVADQPLTNVQGQTITSNVRSSPRKRSRPGISSKVGIVDVTENGVLCLRTRSASLRSNAKIFIITSLETRPQSAVPARIARKLNARCVRNDSDAGENPAKTSYYEIRLDSSKVRPKDIGFGLAILAVSKPITTSKGQVNVDLNGDGVNEYFRSCASSEGLHITVWSGIPLIGRRIWHQYYYLGYDTEPDCKKKDFEGTDE